MCVALGGPEPRGGGCGNLFEVLMTGDGSLHGLRPH